MLGQDCQGPPLVAPWLSGRTSARFLEGPSGKARQQGPPPRPPPQSPTQPPPRHPPPHTPHPPRPTPPHNPPPTRARPWWLPGCRGGPRLGFWKGPPERPASKAPQQGPPS